MLPAIGIGALIGGLTAKQRGGNFLKGALTGAALGGVGGMLGSKAAGHGWFGAGKGGAGIFGLGKGWAGVGIVFFPANTVVFSFIAIFSSYCNH